MVTQRTPGQSQLGNLGSSHAWAHQTYENPALYRGCLGHGWGTEAYGAVDL